MLPLNPFILAGLVFAAIGLIMEAKEDTEKTAKPKAIAGPPGKPGAPGKPGKPGKDGIIIEQEKKKTPPVAKPSDG